jgi:hypothetical protein
MTTSGPGLVWRYTTALDSLGHGVEFRHEVVGERVVAFIEGYAWLHDRPRSVTVLLLRSLPKTVERELRHAVKSFVLSHRRHGRVPGTAVNAWFNA